MAGFAPGGGGDRITGTVRLGPAARRVGDVLRSRGHLVVAWHRTIEGLWIGFPLAVQNGPLHRSHVILTADEAGPFSKRADRGRTIVLTGEPELIPVHAIMVGDLDIEVAKRIGRTLRRAVEASITERGGYAV